MKNKTFSLLKYPGSKRRFIKQINNELIKIDNPSCFIEPFLGSGAVFLNLTENFNKCEKIISEINPNLYLIWKSIQKANFQDFKEFWDENEIEFGKWGSDKESYYKFRDYNNKILFNTFSKTEGIFYYIVSRSCINSLVRWGPNGFNQGFGNRGRSLNFTQDEFNDIQKLFKNTSIFNLDFFELIKDTTLLNDKNIVWFLDPPYLSTSLNSYDKSNNMLEFKDKFYETILKIKGYIIYTDMYTEEIDKILNWRIVEIRDLISIRPDKTAGTLRGKEVMYINF
jgi:DNA adenine methylase